MKKRSYGQSVGVDPFSILCREESREESHGLFQNAGLDWKGQRQKTVEPSDTHEQFSLLYPSLDLFMQHLLKPISEQQQLQWQRIEQHDPVTKVANPDWLKSRLVKGFAKRLSGSSVGSIFGVNKYSSPIKSLTEFLWPSFRGNAACHYGNHHEPIAENMFLNYQIGRTIDGELSKDRQFILKNVDILNFGLCCRKELPLFGYSPDGVLEETWESVDDPSITKTTRVLVEYKCPYSRRNTTISDLQTRLGDLYPQNRIPYTGFENLTLPVPPQYYAQVQWGHRVLFDDVLHHPSPNECPPAWFVVWCPAVHPDIQQRQQQLTSPSSQSYDSDYEPGLSPLEFIEFGNLSQNSTFACSIEGTMQMTRVPHDQEFCSQMQATCERWWKEEYVPVLYDKLCGRLQKGEISCSSQAIDILL